MIVQQLHKKVNFKPSFRFCTIGKQTLSKKCKIYFIFTKLKELGLMNNKNISKSKFSLYLKTAHFWNNVNWWCGNNIFKRQDFGSEVLWYLVTKKEMSFTYYSLTRVIKKKFFRNGKISATFCDPKYKLKCIICSMKERLKNNYWYRSLLHKIISRKSSILKE